MCSLLDPKLQEIEKYSQFFLARSLKSRCEESQVIIPEQINKIEIAKQTINSQINYKEVL